MYEERIAQLDAGVTQYQEQINQFLALADFLYKDLGLIGEVHSTISGDDVSYRLMLIDRPATSVQIVKTYHEDGTQTNWEAVDLSEG